MSRKTTRRKFMQTSAAIGAGYWALGGIAPKESRAAIETINFASIGVGGKGGEDSNDAGRNGNMVAVCDIDEVTLAQAASKWPKAKTYYDFRKMFDEVGKSIDAVTVSTPDHVHAVATSAALKLGKACFTQKPLTRTIHEARTLGELAREKKVATQMGNQGTANNPLREGAAILKSGALGKIKEVHVWTNRPVWPQGISKPEKAEEIPNYTDQSGKPVLDENGKPKPRVHWNEFIAGAPMRPYSGVYHPFKWRGWWDFGTGALGDMACHTLNMPFMGLNLRDPISVQADTSGHNKETYPAWSIITFQFPKTDVSVDGGMKFMWYDGGKIPADDLVKEPFAWLYKERVKDPNNQGQVRSYEDLRKRGALIIGEKGILFAPGDYAGDGLAVFGVDKPKVEWERSPGHFDEWVRAIKGGKPATSNFPDYAGPLTETILLGNLAVWAADKPGTGKKIEWDAKNMKATNAPEVMHIVKCEYHNGYNL